MQIVKKHLAALGLGVVVFMSAGNKVIAVPSDIGAAISAPASRLMHLAAQKQERPEPKAEKAERPAKSEKPEKAQRPSKEDRPSRADKADKSEKSSKEEKASANKKEAAPKHNSKNLKQGIEAKSSSPSGIKGESQKLKEESLTLPANAIGGAAVGAPAPGLNSVSGITGATGLDGIKAKIDALDGNGPSTGLAGAAAGGGLLKDGLVGTGLTAPGTGIKKALSGADSGPGDNIDTAKGLGPAASPMESGLVVSAPAPTATTDVGTKNTATTADTTKTKDATKDNLNSEITGPKSTSDAASTDPNSIDYRREQREKTDAYFQRTLGFVPFSKTNNGAKDSAGGGDRPEDVNASKGPGFVSSGDKAILRGELAKTQPGQGTDGEKKEPAGTMTEAQAKKDNLKTGGNPDATGAPGGPLNASSDAYGQKLKLEMDKKVQN